MDKLIFLNIGWMSSYTGKGEISGGFRQVVRQGFGHEMFNFKSFKGKMYGAAPVPHGSINIEKLGASRAAQSVDNILVIWVARSRIVGWYKNTTVYRHPQPAPKDSGRFYKAKSIGYCVEAAASDCKLILPPDSRVFPVPRAQKRKHAMGRYLWYAEGNANRAFRAKVLRYISSNADPSKIKKQKTLQHHGRFYQNDPQKRTRIEKAATVLV